MRPRSSSGVVEHHTGQVTDLRGLDATQLAPTGAGDLVDQLRAAGRHQILWPWAAVAVAIMAAIATFSTASWPTVVALIAGVPVVVAVWRRDLRLSKVAAVYEVDGPVAQWFSTLVDGYHAVLDLGGAWRVETTTAVVGTYGYKLSGGVESIIGRTSLTRSLSAPRMLRTNIVVPSLAHDRDALLFLPDRILVRHLDQWSDAEYRHVQVQCTREWVKEPERPPQDGTQVDTTWQVVNVRGGGPDRRYRDNRAIPVMEYGHLTLHTATGLHWVIDCSRPEVAEWLAAVLTTRPT
ncbi:hypothetical protein ACFROC_09955 [Nocardia tengchongensis]|uniref:hypothetical protein n=1 Tax=Nocardia tengchongensis TaxID=2055889 RepID=UPI00368DC721